MQKNFGLFAGLGLLALLPAQNAQAQDVKTVAAKTGAVYQHMKTLQVTYETNVAMGSQKGTIQTDVKVLAGQKGSISVHSQGTNKPGTPTKSNSQLVVDDGVNIYVYLSQQNQYVKRPHNPNAILQQVASLYGLPYLSGKDAALKLLPPIQLEGKPVYVVEITPNNAQGKAKFLMMIDQATYHVRQNKMIVSGGPNIGTATTTVKNEILNAPLAPTLFAFTPPKGAREFVPPPQAAMPGAPGGAPRPGAPVAPPRPGGRP